MNQPQIVLHRDPKILPEAPGAPYMIRIPSSMNSRVKSTLPFDQNEFFRGDSTIILPPLILVVTYPLRRSLVIRIDQRDRKRVRLMIDAAIVAQSKGPVEGWMIDGAPEIDDLEAALEEPRGKEVTVHARDG